MKTQNKNTNGPRFTLAAVIAVLLFSAFSCEDDKEQAKESFDLASTRKEIEEQNQSFINQLAKGDSVGMANHYAVDAKFLSSNAPAITGRKNIQSVFSSIVQSGATKLELKVLGLWGTEDFVTDEGEMTFRTKDGALVDKGKYLILWIKEDGQWKIYRDCFNSDLPLSQ